jgi:hypothetical protein
MESSRTLISYHVEKPIYVGKIFVKCYLFLMAKIARQIDSVKMCEVCDSVVFCSSTFWKSMSGTWDNIFCYICSTLNNTSSLLTNGEYCCIRQLRLTTLFSIIKIVNVGESAVNLVRFVLFCHIFTHINVSTLKDCVTLMYIKKQVLVAFDISWFHESIYSPENRKRWIKLVCLCKAVL